MARRLVALDKRPEVRPMGIGETLLWALSKLGMRADRDQAKTECGNLKLCIGLEAGIEGETHAVEKQRLERSKVRRREEEARTSDKEGDTESVVTVFDNLNIDMAVSEEEAVEGLDADLVMEIEEEGEVDSEDK